MNWSKWIRQFHRWMSVAFTIGFVVVFVATMGGEEPPEWLYMLPLLPLFALFGSGLYMFALPYVRRRRAADRTASPD